MQEQISLVLQEKSTAESQYLKLQETSQDGQNEKEKEDLNHLLARYENDLRHLQSSRTVKLSKAAGEVFSKIRSLLPDSQPDEAR